MNFLNKTIFNLIYLFRHRCSQGNQPTRGGLYHQLQNLPLGRALSTESVGIISRTFTEPDVGKVAYR
jgi:hypothetical protein